MKFVYIKDKVNLEGAVHQMNGIKSLIEAFNETAYRIAGNGNRDIQVLKEAFQTVADNTASDIYGSGKVIENFQTKMASVLGKETAVFFPA